MHVRSAYIRRVAEAMILARLGGLMHDLCHIPFGHSIEDDLGVLKPHDENEERFSRLWRDVQRDVRERLQVGDRADWFVELDTLWTGDLLSNLRPLILAKLKTPDGEEIRFPPKYPFVGDMVGNTICADLLDYLQRDHKFTGLPMSLGERFMSAFYVTPSSEVLYPQRMALLLHRAGQERKDVQTELLKHLRYRYELQERVLVHHTKLAADAMVGKMLELWRDALRDALGDERERGGSRVNGNVVQLAAVEDAERPVRVGTTSPRFQEQLEDFFIESGDGDEGLLERLARGDTAGRDAPGAVRELAAALLNRDLYKLAANASGASAREQLHRKFSAPETRWGLEAKAATYAGLERPWHLVVVDHGRGIATFVEHSKQGGDIYELHKALWTISVFGHPAVTQEKRRAVLAKLAELMGVCWWDRYERELGPNPARWPDRLAAMEAMKRPSVDRQVEGLLAAEVQDGIAARGSQPLDHDAARRRYEEIARRKGLVPPGSAASA